MPEEAVENKALIRGKKRPPQTKRSKASETVGYGGVYKVANYALHLLEHQISDRDYIIGQAMNITLLAPGIARPMKG